MDLSALAKCVSDESAPMGKRTRACFLLKSLGSADAISALSGGLSSSSVLLKHEICYVMGQTKNPFANPILTRVLQDLDEDSIVRHEAAEALAAIGSRESLAVLEEFMHDSAQEVSETCRIAVERMKWLESQTESKDNQDQPYESVDPAPPVSSELSVEELERILNDRSGSSLFSRYRAMFSLRNLGTLEAVQALASGFGDDSALFRHEIAYVFGQMRHPASIPALVKVLQDEKEHHMVRHEAAEALGAMEEESVLPLLKQYQSCSERIISESCDVALDIHDYWAT